jgi:dimeric dUTPase (all-alpha-NTP-PPase superfamily)
MSHTPGPWMVAYGSVYTANTKEVRIANMDRSEPSTSPVERDANAQLIAAAPIMLEALEETEATMSNWYVVIAERFGILSKEVDEFYAMKDKIRAAIAKARGE